MPYPPEAAARTRLTPTDAKAISRCILARWRGRPTSMHPDPCPWCSTPADELSDLLHEWEAARERRR